MPGVTLAEIRDAFATHSAIGIHDVATGKQQPEWSDTSMSEQTARLIGPGKRAERAAQRQAGSTDTRQLKKLLASLEQRAAESQKTQGGASGERWTQVPITEYINLTIKGLRDEDLEVAAALGQAIRRLGLDTD